MTTPALIAALLVIAGCNPQIDRQTPPTHQPTASELIATHNANTNRIDQIWARAVVELRWRDDKGNHFEQGEGNLLAILPDRVALSIGKLGHTMFWIGCDQDRYWLFDLRDRDQRTLYVGQHRNAQKPKSRQLPIPVSPSQLVRLLGVLPINPEHLVTDTPQWSTPTETEAGYQIETLLTSDQPHRARYLLEPNTARPIRIELTDGSAQQQTVLGRLSRWRRLKLHATPPGGHPHIATRLEITHPEQDGSATIFLSDPSDGRAHTRLKPRAFNLDELIKALKPHDIIDLDTPPN